MAISGRLLTEGESVVVFTRPHGKALLVPAACLVLVAAAAGYASSFPAVTRHPLPLAVVWGLALLVALRLAVLPFLRWLTTSVTLTDRRLITRTGIVSRRGHDIPVPQIDGVACERGIVDRILGCGTLVVSDASDRDPLRLPDVPHVRQMHRQLSDLLSSGDPGAGERRPDDRA